MVLNIGEGLKKMSNRTTYGRKLYRSFVNEISNTRTTNAIKHCKIEKTEAQRSRDVWLSSKRIEHSLNQYYGVI